jgi:uncharacterized protein (TIGR03067 family)
MKNLLLSLALLSLHQIASSTLAADDDAQAIEGNWAPTSAELGGAPFPAEILQTIKVKLKDGKYDVLVGGVPDKGTYALDASSTPKSLTLKGTEGPNKDKTYPCIYELKGDTLRVCYDLAGAKRPTEFKTTAGTQLYLVTYERKKE